MISGSIAFSAITCLCILTASFGPASAQGEERIYGRQLMSEEEARIYGQKMRAAATDGERQQIRADYQRRMRERAESRGILLPEEAPVRGVGRGMASGKAAGPGKE
jgi:hypothetical protein